MSKAVIILLVCAFFSVPSMANYDFGTYLCVSEESTGFVFRNGKWRSANFEVSEQKFIIRKITSEELSEGYDHLNEYTYGVYPLGEKDPDVLCKEPREWALDFNGLNCGMGGGEFRFYPKTGRFIKTNIASYLFETGRPTISIGRCSKI